MSWNTVLFDFHLKIKFLLEVHIVKLDSHKASVRAIQPPEFWDLDKDRLLFTVDMA